MSSSFKDLESIPWFAIAGGIVIVSLLLYTTANVDFWYVLLPTYLSQAVLYFALAKGLQEKKTEVGVVGFFMSGVWFLNQILLWSGIEATRMVAAPVLWILFLVQLFLGYLFFTEQKVKYISQGGEPFIYASVGIVFLFALAKLILGFTYNLPLSLPLWGIGILLLSLGALLKPVEDDWSVGIQLLGTALACFSALTIGGPGLSTL
jgi:hypothetical protein